MYQHTNGDDGIDRIDPLCRRAAIRFPLVELEL